MLTARTAGLLGLGTTLIAGLGVAGSPAALADSSHGCRTGALPAAVIGEPGVHAQDALGVYLWHGAHGYSLRVTHPGKAKVVVSGRVTVSRDIGALRKVALEKTDRVALKGHSLAFRFANYGAVDGLDFAADCSKAVQVQLRIDGEPATTEQVFLGKDRTAPASLPVTIRRTPTPTPAATPTATPGGTATTTPDPTVTPTPDETPSASV